MTMYYSESDGPEPTVSIQVGGTKYTLTNQSLAQIIEDKDSLKEELDQTQRKVKSIGWDVREFFESRKDGNNTDDITCTVEDINELLKDLGVDQLTNTWSATIFITATITGIEAPDKEAAEEMAKDNIEVNYNDDGDIWVDDVEVQSVHPEA
jgi:flagellar biosynthesis/type III secretory pathway chaperone